MNNEPVEAVEWDRNVEGEQGSRWIQLVHDDGHGYLSGMQILDYFGQFPSAHSFHVKQNLKYPAKILV